MTFLHHFVFVFADRLSYTNQMLSDCKETEAVRQAETRTKERPMQNHHAHAPLHHASVLLCHVEAGGTA